MSHKHVSRILNVAGAMIALSLSASPSRAEKYALLVGVSQYKYIEKPLPQAGEDARELAKALEQCGYKPGNMVILATPRQNDVPNDELKPTAVNILKQLSNLTQRMTENDDLFVFFSGHGFLFRDSYMLPEDAVLERSDPNTLSRVAEKSLVSIQDLVETVKQKKPRIFFAFDMCQTTLGDYNPNYKPKAAGGEPPPRPAIMNTRFFKKAVQDLSPDASGPAKKPIIIVVSASEGQESIEASGRPFSGGVFTRTLIKLLQGQDGGKDPSTGRVDGATVLQRLKVLVRQYASEATNGEKIQEPDVRSDKNADQWLFKALDPDLVVSQLEKSFANADEASAVKWLKTFSELASPPRELTASVKAALARLRDTAVNNPKHRNLVKIIGAEDSIAEWVKFTLRPTVVEPEPAAPAFIKKLDQLIANQAKIDDVKVWLQSNPIVNATDSELSDIQRRIVAINSKQMDDTIDLLRVIDGQLVLRSDVGWPKQLLMQDYFRQAELEEDKLKKKNHYRQGARYCPDDPQAVTALGIAAILDEDLVTAQRKHEEVTRSLTSRSVMLNVLESGLEAAHTRALSSAKQLSGSRAVEAYRKVLEAFPYSRDALVGIASEYTRSPSQYDLSKATDIYVRLQELADKSLNSVIFELGQAFKLAGYEIYGDPAILRFNQLRQHFRSSDADKMASAADDLYVTRQELLTKDPSLAAEVGEYYFLQGVKAFTATQYLADWNPESVEQFFQRSGEMRSPSAPAGMLLVKIVRAEHLEFEDPHRERLFSQLEGEARGQTPWDAIARARIHANRAVDSPDDVRALTDLKLAANVNPRLVMLSNSLIGALLVVRARKVEETDPKRGQDIYAEARAYISDAIKVATRDDPNCLGMLYMALSLCDDPKNALKDAKEHANAAVENARNYTPALKNMIRSWKMELDMRK